MNVLTFPDGLEPGSRIELWGYEEIASHTGMTRGSVARRRWRGEQGEGPGWPPADLVVSGNKLWLSTTIEKYWATENTALL